MKTCTHCTKTKPLIDFAIKRGAPSNICRLCASARAMEYKRSRSGLVTKIYAHQRSHSIARGHTPPPYTNKELLAWTLAQPNFEELYSRWVDSSYAKYKQPSIDRLEDHLPYSFDNIRLVDFRTNEQSSQVANREKALQKKVAMGLISGYRM